MYAYDEERWILGSSPQMTVLACMRMTKKLDSSAIAFPHNDRNKTAVQTGVCIIEMLGGTGNHRNVCHRWRLGSKKSLYQTNNLIEDVRLGGLIVADEMLETVLNADGNVTLNDKITPQTNYSFKAFAEENSTTTFGILAQNIPFNVCEEARKRKADWLEYIWKS